MTDQDRPSLQDELLGGASPESSSGTESPTTAPDRRQRVRRMPWTARAAGDESPGCREIGSAVAGFATFVLVDGVMMLAPFSMKEQPSLLPQALTLLLLAFGLGGMLVWHIKGAWRPYGFGMMFGWVFVTVASAGYLTGINP